MITYNQLITKIKSRKKKTHKNRSPALVSCPQKKAICLKIIQTSPKKPNSAVRKVAKVALSTGKSIIAYIPGHGHNLQQYSSVLVRGGRVKDLPGVHYHLMRGKLDFNWKERIERRKRRSKYGTKKTKVSK